MAAPSNFHLFEQYSSQAKIRNDLEKATFTINIQPSELNMLIRYVLMGNIDRQSALNLEKLAFAIDSSIWDEGGSAYTLDSIHIKKKLLFLRKLVTWYLKGVRDPQMLFDGANREMPVDLRLKPSDVEFYPDRVMLKGEVGMCEQYITTLLDNIYLIENSKLLAQDLTSVTFASDWHEKKKAISKVQEKVQAMYREFKKNASSTNKTKQMMSLDSSIAAMTQTRNDMMDTTKKLITGYKGFNDLIGGGLEGGNVYLIAGPAGTGKSLFVHNLGLSIRKNNPKFRTKNPEKVPVVVYLSQENTMKQTNQRTFYMAAGSTKLNLADYDEQRITEMMLKSGFCPKNEKDIHFYVEYVPNRSIDTSYLYSLYESLYDDGYEMICLIQDHVKRIKSEERTTDPRFELGNVINEFKVFAAQYDIPVIALCHTNRSGSSKMETSTQKYDLVKNYTRDTVGESLLMVDNADWFGTICSEYSEKWGEKKWLGLNVSKSRSSDSSNSVIFMPFEHGTSLNLQEDIASNTACHKRSLNPNLDDSGNMFGQNAINGKPNLYAINNYGGGYTDQEKIEMMTSESKSGAVNMSKKKKASNARANKLFEGEVIVGDPNAKVKSESADLDEVFACISKLETPPTEYLFVWDEKRLKAKSRIDSAKAKAVEAMAKTKEISPVKEEVKEKPVEIEVKKEVVEVKSEPVVCEFEWAMKSQTVKPVMTEFAVSCVKAEVEPAPVVCDFVWAMEPKTVKAVKNELPVCDFAWAV